MKVLVRKMNARKNESEAVNIDNVRPSGGSKRQDMGTSTQRETAVLRTLSAPAILELPCTTPS